MRRALSVVGLFVALTWFAVAGAARDFPQDAARGTISAHQFPHYRIGTAIYRIAAGGRIYNQQNLIVMPASLPPRPLEVMYRLDFSGDLSAIWILTPEEARLHPKPVTRSPPKESGGR